MTNTANFFKNKFKILIIIIFALGLTLILSQTLFWRNTPLINPGFLLQANNLIQKVTNWPNKFFASKETKKIENQPLITNVPEPSIILPTIAPQPTSNIPTNTKLSFQPIATGISTAVNQNGQKYIKIEAGTVVEVTEYTLVDGRRIRVIKPLD